ncbi:uncharacterized protein BCR38DRAFT_452225 [Pseudomassariella vexata]|uniref:Fungal-specific transcription factor domain-domain-containing protein n=1 Tax=Pseudomassariella vexata TaxID=1141098 RepID=A0A1Y2D918_9PEZI|nr:uncharacterized protein BCR38DRAFT_452225 [Pseudomassariella vexata]ORY55707.1 hypothetical protein BCR38DRAFT_452225 [Pseudomassariella vexata]
MSADDDQFSTAPGGTGTTPAQHVCHCGKAFIRKEHLRRHQATHQKPSYTCHVCHRSFTRSDLLRRHANLHVATTAPASRRARACDECHRSKLKCSGGPQCSLCGKRGVNCTFGDTAGSSSNASTVGAGGATAAPLGATTRGGKDELHAQITTDFLRSLTIQTAPASRDADDSRLLVSDETSLHWHYGNDGLEESFRRIVTRSPASLEADLKASDELKYWVSSCSTLYFERFHPHWLILHAPSFDIETESLAVSASIVMIASWLEGSEDSMDLALATHNLLVDRFFVEMSNPGANVRGKAWPIKLYEAVLLNVIFGLYAGKEETLTRVVLLHSLFVSLLRRVGMFSSKSAAYQQNTHFPGTFLPYVQKTQQEWNRLCFYLFKADTYLTILCNQPLNVQPEELDIGLPCSFALANAYGLDIFYKRYPEDTAGRAEHKLSSMLHNSPHSMTTMLLVEDIHIGLCGMSQRVWNVVQLRHIDMIVAQPAGSARDSILDTLNVWKLHLDRISGQLTAQSRSPDFKIKDFPLRAYRKDEDESQPAWRTAALARASSFIFGATLVFHLLSLRLYADPHILSQDSDQNAMPDPAGTIGHSKQVRDWRASKDGRQAVSHAVAVLKALETADTANPDLLDPVGRVAVSTSIDVLKVWVLSGEEACNCTLETSRIDVGRNPAVGQRWVELGGKVIVDGIALCTCSLDILLERFDLAASGA